MAAALFLFKEKPKKGGAAKSDTIDIPVTSAFSGRDLNRLNFVVNHISFFARIA